MKRRITTLIKEHTSDKIIIVSNENTHNLTIMEDYTGSLKDILDMCDSLGYNIKKYDILDL